MANHPTEATTDEQIRELQDQVRRLWTRIPLPGRVTEDIWHSLTPYLNPGWTNYGEFGSPPPINSHFARFRREGPRVWFAGTILNESAGDGAVNPVGTMPSGYGVVSSGQSDNVLWESPDGSENETGAYWLVFIHPSGLSLYTSELFYTGSPSFGGVPQDQAISLDGFNYSVVIDHEDF